MRERFYLAYGSNLNEEQMLYRCPGAVRVGHTKINNYRLMYKGSYSGAYLTIEPCKGGSVPVGVWKVTAADEKALDRYEGYPNFYYKKGFVLSCGKNANGEPIYLDAFVYIMHEDRKLAIPSQHYIDVCTQGYEDFGFDKKILDEALEFTKSGTEDTYRCIYFGRKSR